MKTNQIKVIRLSLIALAIADAAAILVVAAHLFPPLVAMARMAFLIGGLISATTLIMGRIAKNHDVFATALIFTGAAIVSAISIGVMVWL